MEEFLATWQKQQLARKAKPFIMNKDVLYKMRQNNKLRWCLSIIQGQKAMKELHDGTIGGHFVTKIIQKKILDVEY
jgi:hypothetical protein